MPDLKRLQGKHLAILEMHLAGKSNREIALAMDMDWHTVGNVISSPLAQHRISGERSKRMKDARELAQHAKVKALDLLQDAAAVAAKKQIDLLDAESEAVQLQASEKILDRVLGKGTEKLGTGNVEIIFGNKEVKNLQLALEEANLARTD